jgi:NAD(P)-dependent dehydrogenase (short-subunit alcohol dehydrogenase family)
MKGLGTPANNHSSYTMSKAVVDAVMRATALLALMGIAVIHLVQLVPTFEATPLLGAAFIALIAGTLVVGAQLVNPRFSHTRLWLPVLALGATSIGGYVFTRVVNTPLDNQDVGNWACMLGIAALFVEGTLVALSAYAISLASQRRPLANAVPALHIQPTSRLTQVGQANGSRS